MREKEFLPLVNERLGIASLNAMQRKMLDIATEPNDVILLSPTGSGKTLAFVLPMLKFLRPSTGRVQAVIIAPSRELVLQISGIIRQIAPSFKIAPLYGGHKVEDEVNTLSAHPDIVIATPGRLLDHINRRNIDVLPCRMLVLDEFDKSLELGFEKDMKKIVDRLKNVSRIILTSATRADVLPDFLHLNNPTTLDYLEQNRNLRSRLRIHRVDSDSKDKLAGLVSLLLNLYRDWGEWQRTIIFVNYRESAERVADYLQRKHLPVVLYHGALDQHERESAIARFNNGSRPILVATDLAARGLDIEGVGAVIHYHQPLTPEAYTHRNGRTARVDRDGDIYMLIGPDEDVKEYVDFDDTRHLDTLSDYQPLSPSDRMETIRFSAGRREKLSKGDILGFLTKQAGIPAEAVGKIDVFDHYALATLRADAVDNALDTARTTKIKGEKRLVSLLK